MKELKADLWEVEADARVITTNGVVKANGEAVMGGGCALEAAQRYPDLPRKLGYGIKEVGNRVCHFLTEGILTLPTKDDWRHPSDLYLIEKSLKDLVYVVTIFNFPKVVLPRPGCGLGGLDWETQVKPLCEKYLDDRFTVVHNA